MKYNYNDTEWAYTIKPAEEVISITTGVDSYYPQFELMYPKGGNKVHMKFITPQGTQYIDIKVNDGPDEEHVTYKAELTGNGGFWVRPIVPKWMDDDWRGCTIVYDRGDLSMTFHTPHGDRTWDGSFSK